MPFPGTSISDGRATRHGPDGQTDTPFSHKSKMLGTAFVDSNDMSEPKIVSATVLSIIRLIHTK